MIVLDIEALQNPDYRGRGIGRYVSNLLHSLTQLSSLSGKISAVYNPRLDAPGAEAGVPTELKSFPATRSNLRAVNAQTLVTLSPFEKSMNATQRLFREYSPGGRIITLVYDLIPLVYEADYLRTSRDRLMYSFGLEAIRNSDVLMAISEYTKDDISRFLGITTPIHSIGTGVADHFFQPVDQKLSDATFARLSSRYPRLRRGDFIFSVSGMHKSKNIAALIESYAGCTPAFRSRFPLFLVGVKDENGRQDLKRRANLISAKSSGQHCDLQFFDHLSDEDLKVLYEGCRLFAYPSLYEGYGLPLAEALISGATCVTSGVTSLAEILPVKPLHFNPHDIADIRTKLVRGCESNDYRDFLLEWRAKSGARFDWATVAKKFIDVLDSELVQHRRVELRPDRSSLNSTPSTKTRAKLAVVGPMPPAETGIAGYNRKLFPILAKTADVSMFIAEGGMPLIGTEKAYPISALLAARNNFDEVIYVLGNSHHHINTLEVLNRRPGVVWLHDIRLLYLAYSYGAKLESGDSWKYLKRCLREYYGTPDAFSLAGLQNLEKVNQSGILFARPLLQNATGFVVHSENAREMLVKDLGDYLGGRTIEVVPLAIDDLSARIERPVSHAVKVGLIGYMAPVRAPEKAISAVARFSELTARPAEVRIVGRSDESYLQYLAKYAANLGVRLTSTGFLDDTAYLSEIKSLDVALQLRERSNGESSATVAECIALGVPVVTNIQSVREQWSEVVLCANSLSQIAEIAILLTEACSEDFRSTLSARTSELHARMSYSAIARQLVHAFLRLSPSLRDSPPGELFL